MPWKPLDEHDKFPTLGWYALDWIYDNLTVYDGPTLGDPLGFTQEQADFLLRFYEVDPKFEGPAARAGERHLRRGRIVRRALLSRPKGWGKSPLVAAMCLLEALGDIVMDGWDANGQPVGRPWNSVGLKPLVQIVAVSEDQPLALDTPVRTPDGWTTVADLHVGDRVFDEFGNPAVVRRETDVLTGLDCYEVAFDDGEHIVASASHGWTVERLNQHGDKMCLETLTTEEMARSPRRMRIPLVVQQGERANLPVDPYLFGLWLGDGSTDDSSIAIDWRDADEMQALIKAHGESWDELAVEHATGSTGRIRVKRRDGICPRGHDYADGPNRMIYSGYPACRKCCSGSRLGRRDPLLPSLRERLRATGALGRKHIPHAYLYASYEQRMELLRGLVDSDGNITTKGRACFANANVELFDQVCELLTSLGFRWSVTQAAGTARRVHWQPRPHEAVAKLSRKAIRQVNDDRPLSRYRRIKSVTPVAPVPVKCIGIDTPGHLFLAGRRCVPTRNTANTWMPCIDMARNSPVYDNYDIEPMETFINVPRGRIEAVTSAGLSREGFRPVFTAMDQALALDTPIPTPDGWREMGDLEAGDYVYGTSGPVRVSEAKPVSHDHDCYRVTFADHTSVVASAGHLWFSKRVHWPVAHEQVRTTEQMLDGYRYRVPVCRPQPLPEADLVAHPYLLGVWLGDGTRGKCEITVSEHDLEALQANLLAIGVKSWPRRYARRDGATAAVNLTFSRAHGYQGHARPEAAKAIGSLPCYRDKHIPVEYMHSSIEQRTQLLRGLMDTDGHASKAGVCTFVSTEKRLAGGVVELLRSLGQVCSDAKFIRDPRYTSGGKYRVDFTPRGGLVPFALPRKADRVRQHSAGSEWISITSIEPVDRVPVRCIAVESEDHLFAAGRGGHFTHNTESWLQSNGGHRLARTIRRNTMKTGGSTVETPNAFEPGEDSIAEQSWNAHQTQLKGKNRSRKRDLFLDHREADPLTDIFDEDSLRRGLIQAYGDSAAENGGWVNIDGVIDEFWDENTDIQEARRYFLNQITHASDAFLSAPELAACVEPKPVDMGTPIVLGFDGSNGRSRGKADATALVAARLSDGYTWQVLIREPPNNPKEAREWTAPVFEFDMAVQQCFRDFKVVGFYADPSGWEAHVSRWEELYGRKLKVRAGGEGNHPIMAWPRGKTTNVVPYVKRVKSAILASGQARTAALTAADGNKAALKGVGEFTYDGSHELTQHLLNARMRKHTTGYLLAKDFPESPRKIDGAYALVLAWKARLDAVAKGLDRQARSAREVVTLG